MACPSISIIIPAYNCEPFLKATLDSILGQTVDDWECILVDDGSSDGTAAVAQAYVEADGRFRLIRQANGGPSQARNRGFREISPSSRYITFMDSDDLWLPHALETLRDGMECHPDAVGTHALAEFIDEHGRLLHHGEYPEVGRRRLGYDGKRLVIWDLSRPTDFAVLVNGNVLFPPGLVLAKREVYDRVGPFDETFKGPEDWDMLIRLSRHGDLRFINQVLLHYRRHTNNLGAAHGIAEQAWRVRCKAFFSPENTPDQQRIAKGGWRAYQVYMISQRVAAAKRHLASRQLAQAANMLARVPVHAYRYLRGYPTPIIR